MDRSMINSLSSLNGLQQELNNISNNMANLDTAGFKSSDIRFADILNDVQNQPKQYQLAHRITPLGLPLSNGVRTIQTKLNFTEGSLKKTGQPFDLAIEGNGLFEVQVPTTGPNGAAATKSYWTRSGNFQISPDPNTPDTVDLVTSDGYPVIGADGNPVQFPAHSTIKIHPDGTYDITDPSNPYAGGTNVGQIKLMHVIKPEMLRKVSGNLYTIPGTDATGAAINPANILVQVGTPFGTTDNSVKIRQGYLEQSNVNLTKEMANLMMVQRAYELNSRAIMSDDTMMSLADNLRG